MHILNNTIWIHNFLILINLFPKPLRQHTTSMLPKQLPPSRHIPTMCGSLTFVIWRARCLLNCVTFVTVWLGSSPAGWLPPGYSCGPRPPTARLNPTQERGLDWRWPCIRIGSLKAKSVLFTAVRLCIFYFFFPDSMSPFADGFLVCTAALIAQQCSCFNNCLQTGELIRTW